MQSIMIYIFIISYCCIPSTMSKKYKAQQKRQQRFTETSQLIERIGQETPQTGEYLYDYKLEQAKREQQITDNSQFHMKYKINFNDLPISSICLKGLNNRNFVKMTEVQRCVIPHALADRDVLAASRTGSGKTLSYLVPLIEKLYRHKFIPFDGLGAIVLVPVRQLAMQVFEVLNSFTSAIETSVGLIIGGKNVEYEKQRIHNMNILVCTPGRLLQHLEQTYGFEANNLQMLVLDQADVMLQMGFEQTLQAIFEYLPRCQTMLFSATLNPKIHLLANMSLNSPERIFLHSISEGSKDGQTSNIYETPAKLTQYYMLMKPQQKVSTLFSFVKTHQKSKVIVFVSTCKQARFLYQSFKKFRLGLPMYELQGHQKQKKRMALYFTFCEKKYGLMICTNIASRGLDFPMVDWVIQFDIPEDTETYVHRVGRTARFKYEGKALAFVAEHEKDFIDKLLCRNIKIHKIKQNPMKYFNISASLQSICSQHQDVKYLAQRALISYLKFVHKSPDKAIFSISKIDTNRLAESFGLQNPPVISIKQQEPVQNDNEVPKLSKIDKLRMKSKRKKEINEQKIAQKKAQKQEQVSQQNDSSSSQNLLRVKSTHIPDPSAKKILSVSKNRMKKIHNEGLFDGKNKIHFDEDLRVIDDEEHQRRQYVESNKQQAAQGVDFHDVIYENKELDDAAEKERRKLRRKKRMSQIKESRGEISGSKHVAVLGNEQSDASE